MPPTNSPMPARSTPLRALAAATALAVAALLAGCAGSGAVAPVSTSTTSPGASGAAVSAPSGYPEIDAVKAAIGGDWSPVMELPHSVCTPEGGEADSGMQNIATTTSTTSRSTGDAREAARLAGEALAQTGMTAEAPAETEGGATVSATGPTGATALVTVDGTQATIEVRTECAIGDETA